MRWEHLLLMHWNVASDRLRPLIPPPLALDTYRGRAFVTLATLAMPRLAGEGLSSLLGSLSFHEVNVRTYVTHRSGVPGVWFFSLDAGSALAVEGARLFPGLPYFHADVEVREVGDGSIAVRSERIAPGTAPVTLAARCVPAHEPAHAAVKGTLEHFLVERHALHLRRGDAIEQVRVEHAPYPLQRVRVTQLDESLVAAAGIRRPRRAPMAQYVRALDVRALWPERLGDVAA